MRYTRIAAIVVLALAAGTSVLQAQAQGRSPVAPAGARPGAGVAGAPGAATLIQGAVKDSASGQPLEAAAVSVYSGADSSLVTGAITGNGGRFRIEGVRPGAYFVKVTFVGYRTRRINRVVLTPSASTANLGTIGLVVSPVEIAGIQATAERGQVQIQVDRTTYNVKELPSASGGNATDVLRNVPSVEVDIDGNVSVRGNSNVVVQINGRPAPMTGDALTSFLKQLPASMIEKVEVIPNPSAKYDPEGMSGILNLQLKQNAELGISGGANVGVGTGDKYNGSGNLGYQAGNLTFFSSFGFNEDNRENTGWMYRENLYETPTTYLRQDTRGAMDNSGRMFNANMDYKLGAKDVLSSSFMLRRHGGDAENLNAYALRDGAGALLESYDRNSSNRMRMRGMDASLAWKRTVAPRENELSAELRFDRNDDEVDSRFQLLPQSGSTADQQENNALDAVGNETSLQLDYVRALGGGFRLETGYKGTLRGLDNDQRIEVLSGDAPADDSRSNAFEYDENVHAGYALLSKELGKLQLQGGARVERANTQFDLTTTGETFSNDYWSVYPSGSALYSLTDTRQLRASYSRRVQRPDTRVLNPFAFSQDPLNQMRGNPYLDPEYTDAIEVSAQQFGSLGSIQVTPYFRRTTNAIRRFTSVDTAGVSTTTFRNLDVARSWGVDVTSSIRLGQRLNGMVAFNAYRMTTEGDNVQAGYGSDAMAWSARTSLGWKVTPSLDAQWFMMYRGAQETEQGRMGAMAMSNFSLRQKVLGGKGDISLRVSDPFDMMRFSMRTADAMVSQESERKFNARALFLSFGYNFGQKPRLRPREQPQEQQTDMMPGMQQ